MEAVLGTILAVLGIGAVIGALVGWRAGRLHLHAGQRYVEWRDTAHGLPIVRRSALEAIRDAAVYLGGLGVLLVILIILVWSLA